MFCQILSQYLLWMYSNDFGGTAWFTLHYSSTCYTYITQIFDLCHNLLLSSANSFFTVRLLWLKWRWALINIRFCCFLIINMFAWVFSESQLHVYWIVPLNFPIYLNNTSSLFRLFTPNQCNWSDGCSPHTFSAVKSIGELKYAFHFMLLSFCKAEYILRYFKIAKNMFWPISRMYCLYLIDRFFWKSLTPAHYTINSHPISYSTHEFSLHEDHIFILPGYFFANNLTKLAMNEHWFGGDCWVVS